MSALNWKAFQLLCSRRRWCSCWRQWTWWSSCWRCWTWWGTCWRWGEDHIEDCASLTSCGRESFLQVVQLLRSHHTISKRSFSQLKFDWFIIWTWPKASSFSMLALAPEQVLQLASIGEAAASASAIWRKAHFLTFFVSHYVYLLITGRQKKWRRREIKQELTLSSLSLTSVISTSSLDWDLRSLQPSSSLLSFGEASSFLWKITWAHKCVEIILTGSKCITLNQIQ